MGIGYLTVQAHTADHSLPVSGAHVTIKHRDGTVFYERDTDNGGNTEKCALSAPDKEYTLDPAYGLPAYSTCDVDIEAKGFITEHILGVEIVDTQTTILPVNMLPLADEPNPVTDNTIVVAPIALLSTEENRQVGPPGEPIPSAAIETPAARLLEAVVIPDYITVHLGVPTNSAARNVRVRFSDYIKNVVSSEIYSTWPQSSLEANIHAIVTFALNRVYTEWYPSRGFNFDITNSTAYDQFYREGGPVFENISRIVDGIFNVYARRFGFRNPFFTQFCNGSTVTCAGLSQWGTVTLANQGKTPLEILRYYYPNDLELITSNNITGITASYPGYALRLGSEGEPVRRMQNFLNRIRVNFPLIPRISNPNGVFGTDTQDAVRTFQRTFSLTADGIIGKETWNKISFIHTGVTRMAELDGEGERASIGKNPPNSILSMGSRGEDVLQLQFILNAISPYYSSVPTVIKDGVFDTVTKNGVIEFQKTFGLTPDGVVGAQTWNKLYSVYRGIYENAPVPPAEVVPPSDAPVYPGTPLRVGSTGADVRLMQTYLNTIRIIYPNIHYTVVDGIFGPQTQAAVIAFQQEFVLTPDGIIGPVTWDKIVEQFMLATGNASVSLEFPGTLLRLGSTGSYVRLMQSFLADLSARYPSLPSVTVDGVFGPQTQAAVIAFQRLAGLTPDGIIGAMTWNAIVRMRGEINNT